MSEAGFVFERGDTIITRNFFDRNTPEGDVNAHDPENVKVIITDPDGTEIVNADASSLSETGGFYYKWKTSLDDTTGEYEIEWRGWDGTESDPDLRDRECIKAHLTECD